MRPLLQMMVRGAVTVVTVPVKISPLEVGISNDNPLALTVNVHAPVETLPEQDPGPSMINTLTGLSSLLVSHAPPMSQGCFAGGDVLQYTSYAASRTINAGWVYLGSSSDCTEKISQPPSVAIAWQDSQSVHVPEVGHCVKTGTDRLAAISAQDSASSVVVVRTDVPVRHTPLTNLP
jgi:hypothetical protein